MMDLATIVYSILYVLLAVFICVVFPIVGIVYRKEAFWSIPALIFLLITVLSAWNLWSNGLSLISFRYRLDPARMAMYLAIPPSLILLYGIYTNWIRKSSQVKVVKRIENGVSIKYVGILGPTKTDKDIFGKKANRNVLICGSSGSGKTYASNSLLTRAFRDYPKLVLSFKPKDMSLNLSGFEKVEVEDVNAFEDEDAFVRAFMVANPIDKVGVVASNIPSILRLAVRKSKNWDDLIDNLKAMMNSSNQLTVSFILSKVSTLKPKKAGGNWSWDFESNVVLDLSKLNEEQKVLFAEIILNLVWKKLQEKPKNCVIFVDEAHILLRNKYSMYPTIITDVDSEILNQFDTQFVFRTTKKGDLEAIKAIDPDLAKIVKSLKRRVCVDIRQNGDYIELYKFLPPL